MPEMKLIIVFENGKKIIKPENIEELKGKKNVVYHLRSMKITYDLEGKMEEEKKPEEEKKETPEEAKEETPEETKEKVEE